MWRLLLLICSPVVADRIARTDNVGASLTMTQKLGDSVGRGGPLGTLLRPECEIAAMMRDVVQIPIEPIVMHERGKVQVAERAHTVRRKILFATWIGRLDLLQCRHRVSATPVDPVDEAEARKMAGTLARQEGLFAGTSTGLNVVAALQFARELGAGHTVVTVAVDSGLKYLAGDLYAQ